MRIKRFHPIGLLVYFICSLGLTVFVFDPYIALLSLLGAALNLLSLGALRGGRVLALPAFMILISAVANPLFSHRGATELLFINGAPITLEAIIYGAVSGASLGAATLICIFLTEVADEKKIMRIFGGTAPKTAIVLSSAIRFFPELMKKHEEIRNAHRGVGRLPDERPIDRLRSTVRVWLSLIGLAFDDAAEQARLMELSGFDPERPRRAMGGSRFARHDLFFTLTSALLFAAALIGSAMTETAFYPIFSAPRGGICAVFYTAALILFCLPAIINGVMKCRYLRSKT